MPELPEVETTRRGIAPWVENTVIEKIVVRDARLRWPVSGDVHRAEGRPVTSLARRAKYLLIGVDGGALMLHLGMSGSVRVLTGPAEPRKHDHVDIVTGRGTIRFTDPRRFGSLHWVPDPVEAHPLLRDLGPEPLGPAFNGEHLWRKASGSKRSVKTFVMDGKVVVGVGNIYASEALYMAGIHPTRAAGRVSRERYDALAAAIRDVLGRAIEAGGTTLRDFSSAKGTPGYFAQDLLVYDRAGKPCFQCGDAIRRKVIGQRASYYCVRCQR